MFELVICRRQVVRGGEDTKLLLYRWKPKFGSLCELGKLCLNVYLQGDLFFFFFRAGPNVHYGVHRQRYALNLKGIANWPWHMGKKNSQARFAQYKGRKKKKVGAQALKCRSALKSKAFRMKGWKWWFICQTAFLYCCGWNCPRENITLIILTASSNNDRTKLIVEGVIQ